MLRYGIAHQRIVVPEEILQLIRRLLLRRLISLLHPLHFGLLVLVDLPVMRSSNN